MHLEQLKKTIFKQQNLYKMKPITLITEIKTIDIKTLTWFDKINGNTYFAQEITLNFGLDNETEIINPFKYGYSSFEHYAFDAIKKYLSINENIISFNFIRENNIIVRSSTNKSLKRELLALSN